MLSLLVIRWVQQVLHYQCVTHVMNQVYRVAFALGLSVALLGQVEVIPGSMTRGAMGQQLIEVSNFGEDGQPDEVSRFNIKLEQQRRPPQEGCWTIQELFVLQKTRWQELLLEGEDLDGDDAPGGNVEKDGQ